MVWRLKSTALLGLGKSFSSKNFMACSVVFLCISNTLWKPTTLLLCLCKNDLYSESHGTYETERHFSVSPHLVDIFRDILYTSSYSEKTQMIHLELQINNK